MAFLPQRAVCALLRLVLFLVCVFAAGSCSCESEPELEPPLAVVACIEQTPGAPATPLLDPSMKTITPGTLPAKFGVSATGEATLEMRLTHVPGRGNVGPDLALLYNSAAGEGSLGVGFRLTGESAITRCPQNLAQDGEIRDVRFDGADKLCLDQRRLVPVGEGPGFIDYRTLPDTFVKVVGHWAEGATEKTPDSALYFEALLPSGLVVEYGNGAGGKPLARGGVPQAFLATKMRDGRGNAMTYSHCFANRDGYTAEYALTGIQYTGFEGATKIAPSRAVRMAYGTKAAADVRVQYTHGMALQSALRLDAIQMLGPESSLVRQYTFGYQTSPTTRRTLLTSVEECGADGACKPPTRFQYKSDAPGFKRVDTPIAAPTSEQASPMLFDLDGDGLDDMVVPDMDPFASTPQNPITAWFVAHNGGPSALPPYFAKPALAFTQEWPFLGGPFGPDEFPPIQPELGSAIDYDQDGRTDILTHDVYGTSVNETILKALPDQTLEPVDTGIPRPFPLHSPSPPPTLTSPNATVHIGDIDGDGVPDEMQCVDFGADTLSGPDQPAWTLRRWRPAEPGAVPAGFEPKGAPIEPLAGYACSVNFFLSDLNGDGKTEIVVPEALKQGGTKTIAELSFIALSRRDDGRFEVVETKLPLKRVGGRILFMDVNGDHLPDAVVSGFSDHALRTYMNTGMVFADNPAESLVWDGVGDQDAFFHLAVTLDYNGDGLQDFLVPLAGDVAPNVASTLPKWFVLQATGAMNGPTFEAIDAEIPFESFLGDAITLADPRGVRIGDVNGDGAPDAVIVLEGRFSIFENIAPDQDMLVAVSDGMNEHEPDEAGFVPNVSVSYGHLTDASITSALAADEPAREGALYLSHFDPANPCAYPRRCAVGPRRVVSAYAENDGEGGQRHWGLRYRDGRHERLGNGFLGFAERIATDLDTGAGTVEFYDNVTSADIDGRRVFPFAGQPLHQWRFAPPLPGEPSPGPIELSFSDVTQTVVPTNGGKTYFTIPTKTRLRRVEGVYPSPADPSKSLLAYVRDVEAKGGGAVLRDSTINVSDVDDFGHALVVDFATTGVDLTLHMERTVNNDMERWVLGQPDTQKDCSSAAGISQCRTVTYTTTVYGEIETESIGTSDNSPQTKLDVVYKRDPFGNVTRTTTDDVYGHHRVSQTIYDAEGIYPVRVINAADHASEVVYDPRFGALSTLRDANQRITKWHYDSLGRQKLEERPDGTTTTIERTRARVGDPKLGPWRMSERTTTSGGADDTTLYDSLGRPIRVFSHGPDTPEQPGSPPRLMQVIGYDRFNGKVARRSVPTSEGTPDAQLLFDVSEFDAVGREVRHITPWNATTETKYTGLKVEVTDPLLNVTTIENDALGRPVTVTDAAKGITKYTYEPFARLRSVEAPGGAVTRTWHDALGRVWKVEDPNRGTTYQVHDGYGELIASTDALGRQITLEYDALGRTKARVDQKGAEILTTTWTWDTAPHGIGKLHTLKSPDAEKTYAYNALGQFESLSLAISGESEVLTSGLTYDAFGRVATITYPSPNSAAPFVVAQNYDAHGFTLKVRDNSGSAPPYWRLTEVDNAGRFQKEIFGNGAFTERTYDPQKQALAGIVTKSSVGDVQKLGYAYDELLNLKSRTDALQPQNTTERFRYDALERLTCSYFSVIEDPFAPCSQSYGYAPNGNLTFKSDVGVLTYGDPGHPHAVTSAGGETYSYNAVGNQITRPGGTTVAYTPFDLPKAFTQGATTVTLGYDGDERRIRKTKPKEETLYFGDLYERVTEMGSAVTAHRYYVHAPERVVAVVTKGGPNAGTRYLHVDHLGSVDALTNAAGAIDERRSYDPFGQRRNPIWGQPPPPTFGSKTTKGFTGHESDDDLGLVNMKGRLLDPKLGRFTTTDPIVSNLLNGLAFNAYAYVRNNPLSFVDPSGFEEEPAPILPIREGRWTDAEGSINIWLIYPPRAGIPPPDEQPHEASKVGGAAPTVDVGTTGTSPVEVSQVPIAVPSSASAWDIAAGAGRGLANAMLASGAYSVAEVVTGIDVTKWHNLLRVIDAARDSGFWGYLDAANPISPLVDGGLAACDAAIVGDYVTMAEIVAPIATTAVAGLVVGKIASATTEAAGAEQAATRTPPNPYGKLGKPSTRAQNAQISDELVAQGYEVTGGGRTIPEEYIPGPGGSRRGSTSVDITARKPGDTIRVQTVDTLKSGLPTARELRAAGRIIKANPADGLFLIPK